MALVSEGGTAGEVFFCDITKGKFSFPECFRAKMGERKRVERDFFFFGRDFSHFHVTLACS